jgi:hypothetical protein
MPSMALSEGVVIYNVHSSPGIVKKKSGQANGFSQAAPGA